MKNMKKKILAIALYAVSLLAFPAMAQNQTSAQCGMKGCLTQNGCKTTGCTAATCAENGTPACKAANTPCAFDPFNGLNISDSQRAKLNELNKQCSESRRRNKTEKRQVKADSRKAERKAYLDQVKAIIGPEQYVIFLENNFINKGANRPKGKVAGRPGKPGARHAGHGKHAAANCRACPASPTR